MGKLFSARTKDLDDLRALKQHVNKDQLSERLLDTANALMQEPQLKANATHNWYILFGEDLPDQ